MKTTKPKKRANEVPQVASTEYVDQLAKAASTKHMTIGRLWLGIGNTSDTSRYWLDKIP